MATVSFAAAVTARIRVTAPDLLLQMDGPAEVAVGEQIPYKFTIRNAGQGDAKSVFLRSILPEGLKHPGGNDLEYEVGFIPAGETRQVDLRILAAEPRIFTPRAIVSIGGELQAETSADLRVIPSRLQVTRSGPARRFIGRPGTYVTEVTNRSSEVLRGISVVEKIPQGIELGAMHSNWDPARRILTWTIPELQPSESKRFTAELVATSPGTHPGLVVARDQRGNRAELKTALEVKGFADLNVDIARDYMPITLGEQLSLRMSVKNDGNASARRVETTFLIPEALRFVEAKGPVKYDYDPQRNLVTFAALEEVHPDANRGVDFDIVLTAAQVGETDVHVQVRSTEEEQTFKKHVIVVQPDASASSRVGLRE